MRCAYDVHITIRNLRDCGMDCWNYGQEQGRGKMASLDTELYLMQLSVLRTVQVLVITSDRRLISVSCFNLNSRKLSSKRLFLIIV